MPAAMEIGIVMMNASRASLPERNSAGKMIFVTALRLWYESPKSSVNTRRIDVKYWLINGRSVPIWWLYRATSSFEGERAEHAATHVAGDDVDHQEHDRRQDPQRDHRRRQAPQHIPAHGAPFLGLIGAEFRR